MVLNKLNYPVFNACVCVRLLAYLRACVADMLGGRGLIINMV